MKRKHILGIGLTLGTAYTAITLAFAHEDSSYLAYRAKRTDLRITVIPADQCLILLNIAGKPEGAVKRQIVSLEEILGSAHKRNVFGCMEEPWVKDPALPYAPGVPEYTPPEPPTPESQLTLSRFPYGIRRLLARYLKLS